jgi:type IV pilus assembly protein PilM
MSILAKIKTILPQSKFPAVGVDISDSSIEFIQLKIGAKKPQIKTLYRQVIQAGLVENGKIVEFEKIVKILKDAFNQASPKFSSSYCLLSLPDKLTYFAILEIEKLKENWQDDIYNLAQEKLPVNLADFYYDYLTIEDKPGKAEVFFVAAEKERINQYVGLFEAADLNLALVDFESACLARSLLNSDDLINPVFIVDLGAVSTDIIVHDKHGFRDQTNVAFGGYLLTKKIAEILKIETKEAEALKRQKGLFLKQNNLNYILAESFNNIFEEINKMKNAYENKIGQKLKKIILAGGTSLLPGLKELFGQKMPDLIVELGDPTNKINFLPALLKDDKILYSNAIGLALRGLNKESLENGINLIKIAKLKLK